MTKSFFVIELVPISKSYELYREILPYSSALAQDYSDGREFLKSLLFISDPKVIRLGIYIWIIFI